MLVLKRFEEVAGHSNDRGQAKHQSYDDGGNAVFGQQPRNNPGVDAEDRHDCNGNDDVNEVLFHGLRHKKAARRRLIVAVHIRQVMRRGLVRTLRIRVHQARLFSFQGMENLPRVLCVLEFFGGNIWNSHSVLSELQLVLRELKSGIAMLSLFHQK